MPEEETAEEEEEETQETTEGEGDDQTPKTKVEKVETEEESEETTDEESDIPVRSTASYIIERKNRQLEKLRTQVKEPEDLNERLDRLEQLALGQSDDKDLTALFEKEPDAKQYEKTIKAYMEHDAYKGVDPLVIYHHLDYQVSAEKTDSKRKAADLEAGQTKSAGSGARESRSKDQKTAQDIKSMTDAEFVEYEQEQRRLARS